MYSSSLRKIPRPLQKKSVLFIMNNLHFIPCALICSRYDILEQVDILTFTILLKYQHDNAAGYLIKTVGVT